MTGTRHRLPPWMIEDLTGGFETRGLARSFGAAIGTLAFFFPFSLLFVAGGFLPAGLAWMSSAIIMLSGAATLLSEFRSTRVRTAVARFILIAGILWILEFVGVRTGFPFGSYVYSRELGLAIANVPLAISIAWYCTVINAWRIAEYLCRQMGVEAPVVTALVAGVFALALDIALEPMAGFVQRYWIWEGGTVPLQNYLSWFVLSTSAVYLLVRKKTERSQPGGLSRFRVALFLFGFHFVLFVTTIIVNGYGVESLIALVLASTPFVVQAQRGRLLRPGAASR